MRVDALRAGGHATVLGARRARVAVDGDVVEARAVFVAVVGDHSHLPAGVVPRSGGLGRGPGSRLLCLAVQRVGEQRRAQGAGYLRVEHRVRRAT